MNPGRFAIGFLICSMAGAADWPNFRGPRHDGISEEKNFKTTWSEPIPLIWEREVGSAFSSFACVGDAIYTCGTQQKQQVLFRLHAKTGAVEWTVPFEDDYREPQGGDGTRATPTVVDGLVYILGARGTLLCVNAESGSEVWRKKFSHKPQWGYSGSVLVEGDLAVASAGKDEGALVAFDRKSGVERWRCGDDPVGYATPYPFTWQGKRYIVGFTGDSVVIAQATDGHLVYTRPWKTNYNVNAASPIFHDGHLFLGSGYESGCGLLKLKKDGDRLDADMVWESQVFMTKFQSCHLLDGKLYGSDQRAMVCADFFTGLEHWRKPRIKNGTMVIADGNVLLLTESGQLQIGKASPEDFVPTTSAQLLDDRCWSAPVLNEGRLYVRNLDRVKCFNLRP